MLRCASTPRINPYECALTKVTRIFLDSSMVEHSAVNRVVVGSSPTRGAKEQRSCSSIGIWKGKEAIRLRGQAVKTSPFHGGNTGSIPVGVTSIKQCIISYRADVAQLAEQLICNQQVIGSSPIIGFHQLSWKDGYGPLAQLVRATGS